MSSLRRRAIVVTFARSTERSAGRRPGERADDRRRVAGVGQHPQPGEHVADLGAAEEGRVAGVAERDAALLERRRGQPALAPARAGDHADPLRRGPRRRRAGARSRGRRPAPGRARSRSARSGSRPGSAATRPRSISAAPGWAARKAASAASPAPRKRRVACAGSQAQTRLPCDAERLEHRAVREPGVLELVGEHVAEALGDLLGDVGAVAPAGWPSSSTRSPPSRLPASLQDPVVAGVEIGELDLALGPLALGRRSRRRARRATAHSRSAAGATASALSRSMRRSRRASRPAGLPRISWRRSGSSSSRSSRIASRSAGPTVVKNGSRPASSRVLAQQRLGRLLVGVDPELLVRAVEQQLGSLAQPRPRRARAGRGRARAPGACRAPASASSRSASASVRPEPASPSDQQRALAVRGDRALRIGGRVGRPGAP